MSKRILFVASVFSHLASFHKPYMLMLREKGYEIHAAASASSGRMDEIQALGVYCWDIPFVRTPYSFSNYKAYRILEKLFRSHRFELLHLHTPVAAFLGRYLAKKTGQGKVIYTAHGFHFYKGAPLRNWLIYYPVERLAARWTDYLIVMNREDYEISIRMGFRPNENLFFINGIGVDIDYYSHPADMNSSIRKELGIGDNETIVTCIAELNSNKNQKFLLDAWKIIAEHGSSAHLLLVGDGQLRFSYENYITKNKIPRVHLVGYRREIPAILAESDVVTLVSKREGLPRCLLEAMAAGKPIVATNIRGNKDLVVPGETGFLVDLGNVQGLAEAIGTLITNPEMISLMGGKAKQRVKNYSLVNVIRVMGQIYDKCLDENNE